MAGIVLAMPIGTAALAGAADRAATPPPAGAIDVGPVLEVGPYHVSGYLAEKYFTRFVAAERQRRGEPPDADERKRWLEGFLTRHVMLPRAATLGYDRRPEIVGLVARMERYMLTQADGPFYRTLYDSSPLSAARLARLHAQSRLSVDALLVKFPDAPAARAALGADFDDCPLSEKIARLERGRKADGAVWHRGPLAWPFGPFIEIADILADEQASWIESRGSEGAVYLGEVRARSRRSGPSLEEERASFEPYVRALDRETFLRARRVRLLATAGFKLELPAMARLADKVATLPPDAARIPTSVTESSRREVLFRYRTDPHGAPVAVTIESYVEWFNGLLVRRLPRTAADMRLSAENMAVEELDFRAARAAGVDRTPQFVEDRRGFRQLQILELFEREQLEPKIEITGAEIDAYRREHASDFVRVDAVRGWHLTFPDAERMAAWLAEPQTANADALWRMGIVANELEVGIGRPAPGFEREVDAILQMPEGSRFGPLPHGTGFALFIKKKNLSKAPWPAEEAAKSIRPILLRRRLDDEERRIASDVARDIDIRVALDPRRFGLDAALDLPWQNHRRP